jgi:hypothetical protein
VGATGFTGPTGLTGATGFTGPTGLTGPTGPGFNAIINPAANRILTATGTSATVAQAQSNLVFDSTTNRLGINTTAPAASLDVSGGTMRLWGSAPSNVVYDAAGGVNQKAWLHAYNNTAATFSVQDDVPGTTSAWMQVIRSGSTPQSTSFFTSTGRTMILSNGRVGVNTAAPNYTVDISGNPANLVLGSIAATGSGLLLQGTNNTGFIRPQAASSVLYLGASNINTLMVTASNVGMGTSLPRAGLGSANALDISGCVYGRLPVTVYTTSDALNLNTNFNAYANSYIYLTNTGFGAVTLPTATATTSGGTYFQLKNSTASYMSITLTNTLGLVTPVVIAPSNAITFVVSPTTADRMLLF